MFRYVYGEQYELSDGGAGNGASWKRHDSGSLFRAYQTGQKSGYAGNGDAEEGDPAPGYHDGTGIHECADSGYGSWMFHQQYAASSGDCP